MNHEPLSASEPSLAELTGRQIDIDSYLAKIGANPKNRLINLYDYAQRQLIVNSDLTNKVARFGERTPIAPNLPEITFRLERALYLSGPMPAPTDEVLETLAYWEAELQEAKDYFDA